MYGKDINEIKTISNLLHKKLKQYIGTKNGFVYEPVPAPIDKIKNKYRWRLIIKGKVNNSMIEAINLSLNSIKQNKSTSIIVDINPNNMN